MSLDVSKLKNVQHKDGKIIAECPACAAHGHDATGDHLIIYDTGAYGCVANQGDQAHSKEIYKLAGGSPSNSQGPVPVRVRRPACANAAPKLIMVLDWLKKPAIQPKRAETEAEELRPRPEICPPLPPAPESNCKGAVLASSGNPFSCRAPSLVDLNQIYVKKQTNTDQPHAHARVP